MALLLSGIEADYLVSQHSQSLGIPTKAGSELHYRASGLVLRPCIVVQTGVSPAMNSCPTDLHLYL